MFAIAAARAARAMAFVTLAAAASVGVASAETGKGEYTADGRAPLAQLERRYESLATEHHWQPDTIYAYPGDYELAIRAWRTPRRGEALWMLAGIHGEEPAGPNAIARSLQSIVELAGAGVPVVLA